MSDGQHGEPCPSSPAYAAHPVALRIPPRGLLSCSSSFRPSLISSGEMASTHVDTEGRRSQRGSDRRYQSGQRGRLKHAERSRRYCRRRRSVPEHSSPMTRDVSTAASNKRTATRLASAPTSGERGSFHQIKCHFCRRWCEPWVRHTSLRHRSGP
jgi:hypothetical protein